jgi:hypothetical protein
MKIRRTLEQQKIKSLYQLTSTISDDETKAHMVKYLCVQSSGYLENVVKSLIEEYIDKSCPKPVVNFIRKKVNRLTNLEYDKLCDFLDSFNSDWKNTFCKSISEEQVSALKSIVTQRNAIAHGNPSNMTFLMMRSYFLNLEEIVILLESIIKK